MLILQAMKKMLEIVGSQKNLNKVGTSKLDLKKGFGSDLLMVLLL